MPFMPLNGYLWWIMSPPSIAPGRDAPVFGHKKRTPVSRYPYFYRISDLCRPLVLGRRCQLVAYAGYSQNILAVVLVSFELLPQTSYEHAQILSFSSVLGTPYFVQKIGVRKHLTRAKCQFCQQAVFCRCQLYFTASNRYPSLSKVNLEVTTPEGWRNRFRPCRLTPP